MDWLIVQSLLLKLCFAALGVIMLMQLLGWFDARIKARLAAGDDSPFVAAWSKMLTEPSAIAIYLGARILAAAHLIASVMAALLLVIVLLPGQAGAAPVFPRQYDRQIEQAAQRYLPGVPWRLWKAQLYQESRLDPNARSPAGAEGMAQFMPATWREITRAMELGLVDRRMAEPSIAAGAYYMARLRRQWSAERPELDRHNLAMASYNAGIGHILAAQRLCGDPRLYEAIMACLGQVTGRHAAETRGYAPAIRRWHAMMEVAR